MSTIGLKNLDDFQKIKATIDSNRSLEENHKRKKKRVVKEKPTLSFDMDDDMEEELKIMKNPTVDTSFLPDSKRDEIYSKERERLRHIWLEEQEKLKGKVVG